MNTPFVRVMGTADWRPSKDNNSSCYTVSDRLLVDTGWSAATDLLNHDIDPCSLSSILFTHMHADHYMGLPGLLMYWRVVRQGDLGGLTIYGPAPTVETWVDESLRFVFRTEKKLREEMPVLPRVVPLCEGDRFQAGGFTVDVTEAMHADPGVCYRVTDGQTGHSVGFTGDTMYQEKYGAFFRGCDLLLHEASFGAEPVTPENNGACKHSSAYEAVRVAEEAAVSRLLLTHAFADKQPAAVALARRLTSRPVSFATPWQVYPF